MSIITIYYNKKSKTVRLLDKESKQTKDVSESALINALKHKIISVENLTLNKEQLKGTNGSIDRYTSNALTVINTIKNQNETIGFELSDCNGNIKKLNYNDCLDAAKQYGLTNAKLTSSNDREIISSISGEHEAVEVSKIKEIQDKVKELSLETNKKIYNCITKHIPKARGIIIYSEKNDSIQFANWEMALGYPQYSIFVTDMSHMFDGCELKSLDLSPLNTSKVTDMSHMFYNCKAQLLNLLSLDTSNVTNMNHMFGNCRAKLLDLSSFDTSNVTDMSWMFDGCEADCINLSSFNTSKVTDMRCMFSDCEAQSLKLSSFNTSKVTDMVSMFNNCRVTYLDLSSFDTSNVTDMKWMFSNCKLQSLDLSSFNTSNVTNMCWMFYGCELESLDFSSFNTSKVTNMRCMFNKCKVESLDLSYFNTSKVTNTISMFNDCEVSLIKCNSKLGQIAAKAKCSANIEIIE